MKSYLVMLVCLILAGCQNHSPSPQLAPTGILQLKGDSQNLVAADAILAGPKVSDFKEITYSCNDGLTGGGANSNGKCISFNDGYSFAVHTCTDHKGIQNVNLVGACLAVVPQDTGIQGTTSVNTACAEPSFAKCQLPVAATFSISGGPICDPKQACPQYFASYIVKSDAKGHFLVKLPPGRYELQPFKDPATSLLYSFSPISLTVKANVLAVQNIVGNLLVIDPPPKR